MHSHVVEFLSAVFARFNVTFYLEYHCTAVSEVSRGKKWSMNLFKLSRFRKRNTHTVQQTLEITKKKQKKLGYFTKSAHACFTLMFWNEHRWNLIFFLAWHVIENLLHKEESSLIFSAKKLICVRKKSVPETARLISKVNKYIAELSFGSSCNTFNIAKGLKCQQKFA